MLLCNCVVRLQLLDRSIGHQRGAFEVVCTFPRERHADADGDAADNQQAPLLRQAGDFQPPHHVQQQASEFASSVGQELSKTAENQKARGVDAIQCFARAITCAAAELEGQSPQVAQSVRDAAKKVEDFSENISSRNVDELVKAATELARSQPMIFIGGAVAAGFALSRFLKSSANNSSANNQGAASHQSSMAAGHQSNVQAHS